MTAQPTPLVGRGAPLLVGVAGLGLAAFLGGLRLHPVEAWAALLTSSFLFLTLGLGGLVLGAILAVSNSGWHAALKRVLEALAAWLPTGPVAATRARALQGSSLAAKRIRPGPGGHVPRASFGRSSAQAARASRASRGMCASTSSSQGAPSISRWTATKASTS